MLVWIEWNGDAVEHTLSTLQDELHLSQGFRKFLGLCLNQLPALYLRVLSGEILHTFAAPAGPSSFSICSFACFGKSTVFVRGRRPKRNDILGGVLFVCRVEAKCLHCASALEEGVVDSAVVGDGKGEHVGGRKPAQNHNTVVCL